MYFRILPIVWAILTFIWSPNHPIKLGAEAMPPIVTAV
jgi:hypothetical protein